MMIDVLGLDFLFDQIVNCERSVEEIEFTIQLSLSLMWRSVGAVDDTTSESISLIRYVRCTDMFCVCMHM